MRKKYKYLCIIALAVIIGFSAAGCDILTNIINNSYVGTWEGKDYRDYDIKIVITRTTINIIYPNGEAEDKDYTPLFDIKGESMSFRKPDPNSNSDLDMTWGFAEVIGDTMRVVWYGAGPGPGYNHAEYTLTRK